MYIEHVKLTNQTEPNDAHESHNRQDSQTHPESWCNIQAQPKEPLVGGCHGADAGIGGFKDPLRVAG